MEQFLIKYFEFLLAEMQKDVLPYRDFWIMIWVFPVIFYSLFLFVKYLVLTMPIWIIINMVFGSLRHSLISVFNQIFTDIKSSSKK